MPVKLKIKPKTLDFGNVKMGAKKSMNVSVANPKGKKKKHGLPVIIEGAPSLADFTVSNDCPAMLTPGHKCKIGVTFTPTAKGKVSDSLTIHDNAIGGQQTVHLVGAGEQ